VRSAHCNDFINNAALAVPNKQHVIARSIQVEQVVYYIHTCAPTLPQGGQSQLAQQQTSEQVKKATYSLDGGRLLADGSQYQILLMQTNKYFFNHACCLQAQVCVTGACIDVTATKVIIR